MLFNNSGGARISISYSIFDVPTNRLQTVSFQLAPLLLTKAGQTPWERARPTTRGPTQGFFISCSLWGAPRWSPLPPPLPPLYLPLFSLYHLTWDQVIFSSPEVRAQLHFQDSSDLLANWLRCKPSQQGYDFEVTVLCRAPGTSLSVCQIPAGQACCSGLLIKTARVITLYYKVQVHAGTLLQACH